MVVTFRHVSKDYRGGRRPVYALSDVSFHVPTGTFCAVMGPSGCGKSTLLNLIAGLDSLSGGDIVLDGRSVSDFGDAEWTVARRELIGMVFQSFHLIPGLSAAENVALPLLLRGESGTTVRQRVEETLDLVELRGRATRRPGEMSGGEQQRVAIARALVHRPPLLLADEPTGNLDSRNAVEIVTLLRTVATTAGQTVIMATHSEAAAARADHVQRLKDGRLLDQRTGAA